MAVSGKITTRLDLTHTESLDLTTPSETLPWIDFDVASGTIAASMDLLWHDQRTLAASATEDLDLSGSLVDAFGTTMAFVDVRMIVVKASTANTNDVLVGGAAANQFINWVSDASDVVVVKPGAMFMLYSPADPSYAVTAATGDLLKIANSAAGTGVTYDIYIGGTSA